MHPCNPNKSFIPQLNFNVQGQCYSNQIQPPRLPEVWRADKYINMIRGNISAGNICGRDEKTLGLRFMSVFTILNIVLCEILVIVEIWNWSVHKRFSCSTRFFFVSSETTQSFNFYHWTSVGSVSCLNITMPAPSGLSGGKSLARERMEEKAEQVY